MVRADDSVEPLFIGALRGIDKDILPTSEFRHELLDLHPLYRSRVWENWKTLRGAFSAWRRLAQLFRDRPAAVVATGGYASGLTLAYAATHRVPIILQEQNSYPGVTTRFFSRYARQIHLGFPEARAKLHSSAETRIFDSGNPIEPPPARVPDPVAARARWNFPGDARVLLIYGGSQGAQAINTVVSDWLDADNPESLHVIWATGKKNFDAFARHESPRVRVRPYLAPIADAYAATDFAISRGGAMATAELCAWGIPPIVVPLPTAAADHQTFNARALAAAGAADWIPQAEFTPTVLRDKVRQLLQNPQLLQSRKSAALARARPDAARQNAQAILDLIESK
jgi:UDP-N-acetylglucosamine--N-acetylmuramyl-(pentapeptide) pyrophosphoryl-undecaprenol N-acetylglucosamine transferase